MKSENVRGLTLRLSPGVLPAHDPMAPDFLREWTEDLMLGSLDLRVANFWSDPKVLDYDGGHPANHTAGKIRVFEWTRAADIVHRLAEGQGKSPGYICSWSQLIFRHVGDDLLLVEGAKPVRS